MIKRSERQEHGGCLQEGVGAVLGHDAVGLRLFGLVFVLELIADVVVVFGEELLGLEGGDTARS
jgi:hypothetical protein